MNETNWKTTIHSTMVDGRHRYHLNSYSNTKYQSTSFNAIVTGCMMRLFYFSRRIATLVFLAVYAIKSFPLVFQSSSLTAFSSPTLIWPTQENADDESSMSIMEATRLVADCQRALSRSPKPPPRINMTLRRGHLTQNLYNKLKCVSPVSLKNNSTRYMQPTMKNTPGVFDFTTFLSTDLKILVMGDSVGLQISQVLEEMLGGKPENRKVLRYSWGLIEGIHVSAPIRGGGVVAGYRILGLLRKEYLTRKLPNVGPGWRMEDAYNLTHHTYNMTTIQSGFNDKYNYTNGYGTQQQQQQQIGSFDVLLFHIPIGWILDYESIHNNSLMETVMLAGELFGVKTMVFNVPGFTNNILDARLLQSLRAVQRRVIQFSNGYVPPQPPQKTTTVQHVLTLRTDQLMDKAMEWNARLLGMIPNVTTTTATTTVSSDINENDWRLVRLGRPVRKGKQKFVHHVAQSCSVLPSPVENKDGKCTRNHFSLDGMHICMETMGGRLFAGLGCVLGCVYNDKNKSSFLREECQHDNENDAILQCANACNDRYLSLTSVENEVQDE